jgi:catechol 2,3-dioxygenase-like lactoylglutathione lyase family enzyme
MKIEHIGFLVPAPVSMGKWYCEHLGFRLLRAAGDDNAGGVFLKDDDSGAVLEFCKVAGKRLADYRVMDPLQAHLAIESPDPYALAERLTAAGATVVEQTPNTPGSTRIVLVRDPWGFVLQLINRVDTLES